MVLQTMLLYRLTGGPAAQISENLAFVGLLSAATETIGGWQVLHDEDLSKGCF